MRTDVAGAARMGIDSLFIAGGIHKAELMNGGKVDTPAFARLAQRYAVQARYLADEFRW
jgi:ribonucleotide monophosphatase NagD (HAD superfamily)